MESLNKYLFQALDAYPFSLEETAEALQYALSYDDKSPATLLLLGRLYAEQFCDFETAKTYFQEALTEDINNIQVYRYYSQVLIMNGDLVEAEKLINFAYTIKGIDKAVLLVNKAYLLEKKKQYKLAIKHIEKAKEFTFNREFMTQLKEEKNRIKKKMGKKKKK